MTLIAKGVAKILNITQVQREGTIIRPTAEALNVEKEQAVKETKE